MIREKTKTGCSYVTSTGDKKIENTKKKRIFYTNCFTTHIKENNNIRLDRKRLFGIINKNNNTSLKNV